MTSPTRTIWRAVAACILCAAPGAAQQMASGDATRKGPILRVWGVVVDADRGMPVPGAVVVLDGAHSVRSAEGGEFIFRGMEPGDHEIRALTRACAVATGTFRLEPGQDAMVRVAVASEEAAWAPSMGASVQRLQEELEAQAGGSLLEVVRAAAPDVLDGDVRLRVDGVALDRNVEVVLGAMRAEQAERVEIVRERAGKITVVVGTADGRARSDACAAGPRTAVAPTRH